LREGFHERTRANRVLVDDHEVTRSYFNAVFVDGECDVLPRRVGIAPSRCGASNEVMTGEWL
jgi:hypothetical protein